MTSEATRAGLSLLEAAWRAQPENLVEVLAVVWRAAKGHRCRHCDQPIILSPGAGEPYWYHPTASTVWCSGWGDPAETGKQAEPA